MALMLSFLWELTSSLPKTARESPAFATYSMPLHMMPMRQQDPTEARRGFFNHSFSTKLRNSSSVSKNAFFITSSDIPSFSESLYQSNPFTRPFASPFLLEFSASPDDDDLQQGDTIRLIVAVTITHIALSAPVLSLELPTYKLFQALFQAISFAVEKDYFFRLCDGSLILH
ncbi:hypothetical protein G2W53_027768 [Senna tora]|uniref:Uncharacterized protein n=1 Tax=Senna tora TaxID=362788 RepID=A0A834THK3_9FABA|nr:hypothetical protein G2W53_027768 [Senna tora]